ncbi:MAG: type II secretion system protein [Candidatus Staskawiczbacteria bacterium]|nr:type II secretion system protein [Candidatus Staskawiczbacteria bacterium]
MKSSKGFTLIELAVVMAVFLFVIGAAVGIFIAVVQHQRSILAEQEILNQISYVQEHVSKALRMARKELPGEECLVDHSSPNGSNHQGYMYLLTRFDSSQIFRGIKFIEPFDDGTYKCIEFFFDTTDSTLKEIVDNNDAIALTPAGLELVDVRFSVNGSDGTAEACGDVNNCGATVADAIQPRVTLILSVKIPGDIGDGKELTRVFQTTVSQRNLNAK